MVSLVLKVKKNYNPIPRRDSISRHITPQVEILPLDHDARAGLKKLRVDLKTKQNKTVPNVRLGIFAGQNKTELVIL
jgi:hypothetical protein